jgi:hypothetical protein
MARSPYQVSRPPSPLVCQNPRPSRVVTESYFYLDDLTTIKSNSIFLIAIESSQRRTAPRRGVFKEVEDGCRPLNLWATTAKTVIRPFQGRPPAGRRKVGHGGP